MNETLFPPPPAEYELNVFLAEIAQELTRDDLEIMKFIIKGREGIGSDILRNISSPLRFIEELKFHNLVNVNNIAILQTLLWHTDRKDLYKKMVEFGEQQKDVLYIHTPNAQPVHGCEYVEFHVEGRLYKETLEDLQSKLAKWLRVPLHCVVVAGIEVTQSFTITLMIPKVCSEMLRKYAVLNSKFLLSKGIDRLKLDEDVIDLRDDSNTSVPSNEDDDLSVQEVKRLTEVNKYLKSEVDRLRSRLRYGTVVHYCKRHPVQEKKKNKN